MFGRLKQTRVTNNSYETAEYTSGSSDSEDDLRIHTPPTVLIRYVFTLNFLSVYSIYFN